jgi:hypothetical protein
MIKRGSHKNPSGFVEFSGSDMDISLGLDALMQRSKISTNKRLTLISEIF